MFYSQIHGFVIMPNMISDKTGVEAFIVLSDILEDEFNAVQWSLVIGSVRLL